MAAESITVYIDTTQLALQKQNNYSLYLAKKVNGQYTVIWQSLGAVTGAGSPTYEYKNSFSIEVPYYEVNYGTLSTTEGSVTFQAGGKPVSISIGQSVELSDLGIFALPTNTGTAGKISIDNKLQNNPHVVLLDNAGNPIFINTSSGMDIGSATLTPIDEYQIWFDNYQATGTIISDQASKVQTVVFDGQTTDQVISYNSAGEWETGPLPAYAGLALSGPDAKANGALSVAVLATFRYALTAVAATYLVNKLIDKFSSGLRPRKITAQAGSTLLHVEFEGDEIRRFAGTHGLTKFETAVNLALKQAKADTASDLRSETWNISEPSLTAQY